MGHEWTPYLGVAVVVTLNAVAALAMALSGNTTSVVVFGSLWGFWGIFFAIPLATLAKSILDALLELNAEQKP